MLQEKLSCLIDRYEKLGRIRFDCSFKACHACRTMVDGKAWRQMIRM